MTTARAVAKVLADAGIERVFGLPGGEVLVLIDELRKAGIDFVLMRHEANAGIAASVYGKLRGQPGVVLATLGPGAANLLLPISSAYLDQEPLLAITAQLPGELPPSHTHQLLPLHEIYRPVCRLVDQITCDNAADVVGRAMSACMARPFGAAYLTLSAREALKPATPRPPIKGGPTELDAPMNRAPTKADVVGPHLMGGRDSAGRARELRTRLAAAERPLVLIGLGIDNGNATRIRRWLDEWNLPVAVTPKVKGIVDETGLNFVGVISGMAADGLMVEALKASDLLIGVGLDPVEVDKTWHAELPIEWILEAPNVAGLVPAGVDLVDHAAFLEAIASAPPPRRWDRPFATFQERRQDLLVQRHDLLVRRGGSSDPPVPLDPHEPPATMWPGDLIHALSSAVPASTIVTTDVGSHKYLFGQFWPSRHPGTFWMSNGLSGMAYGLSAAIGAKLAHPDVPVLAAVGDGGFSMNAQELETAERVGAPFVTVVLEDGSYSLIKLAQENRQLPAHRMDFRPIDTVKMAEACGVAALRTANPEELATAVRRAVEQNRSLVVGVPVNYADYKLLFLGKVGATASTEMALGSPRSAWTPGSSKVMPEPGSRSTTVRETWTPWGSAASAALKCRPPGTLSVGSFNRHGYGTVGLPMPHLFDPLTIRSQTFANRVFVSPMCEYSSDDGFANDWHLVHLGSRAVGGAGLVLTEATAVTAEGRISPQDLGIWKDDHIDVLSRIARFIHQQGSAAGMQLAHAGRKASTYRPWSGSGAVPSAEGGWSEVLAPSAVPFADNYPMPRELTLDGIARVTAAFVDATRRAHLAGFRVIELHAAHGYLLHEFLSPLSNQRDDQYGGSFDNRTRLVREVVSAMRRVWPEQQPLFVRISATDWVDGGWDIEQSVALAGQLKPLGVDFIDCSSGGNAAHATIPIGPGYQAPFAERIRRDAGILTGAVGLITEPSQAEEIVARGQADAVLLARELLRDPYFPMRAAGELGQDITWPAQYLRAGPKGARPRAWQP